MKRVFLWLRGSSTSFLLSLFLWHGLALFLRSPLFPEPLEVAGALYRLLAGQSLYINLLASVRIVGAGYALSVALALPGACLCFRSKYAASLILPSHEFVRYIPVPAFVPLAAALLGVGDATKISLIFVGTYFQMIFLFVADLSAPPEEIEESARTLGIKGFKLLARITIPAASFYLLTSLRVTFAWSWSYLLVAEVVNAKKGIGYLVLQSYRVLNMERLVALLVVIGIFGLGVDSLFKLATKRYCSWHYDKASTFNA